VPPYAIFKLALALLSGLLSLHSALAAEPKPDVTVKTKAIEANVFLDDKIKADPGVVGRQPRRGQKWLDKNAADAASELKQDPQFFKDGGWAFERKYAVRSIVAERYVSVTRSDYIDTHGAHPNSDINTILWDESAAKRVSIRSFLNETADNSTTMTAMRKAVIAALRIERKKPGSEASAREEWLKGVEPRPTGIGAVALAPSTEAGKSSGFIFYFPPYAVGPHADGQYAAFVPWETLKS
jgi:hypothetical protein